MPRHKTADDVTDLEGIDDLIDRKQQAYMRRAVAELQKVHRLSERDAASIMITVTSVVGLGPKSAR